MRFSRCLVRQGITFSVWNEKNHTRSQLQYHLRIIQNIFRRHFQISSSRNLPPLSRKNVYAAERLRRCERKSNMSANFRDRQTPPPPEKIIFNAFPEAHDKRRTNMTVKSGKTFISGESKSCKLMSLAWRSHTCAYVLKSRIRNNTSTLKKIGTDGTVRLRKLRDC